MQSRAFLLGSLIIVACNGSRAVGPPATDGNLSAVVGATGFDATSVFAGFDEGDFTISAVEEGDVRKSITIMVHGVDGIGSFQLDASGNAGSYVEADTVETRSWVVAPHAGSGSVVFTELSSTRVVGTFSFSADALISSGALGTRSVTSGTFDVKPWRNR
jgi:hypothetical protein